MPRWFGLGILLVAGQAQASRRAVIVEVQGDVAPLLLETMTARWRAEVATVNDYQWVQTTMTLAGLRLVLDCSRLTEMCWQVIGKRLGTDVIFVARIDQGRAFFERRDSGSGQTVAQDDVLLESTEPARLESFVRAAALFVRGQDPERVTTQPVMHRKFEAGDPWRRVGVETWALASVSVAFFAGGIAMGLAAWSAESALNSTDRSCVTAEDYALCQQLLDRANSRAMAANLLFAAAGVTAVTAGVMIYVSLENVGATANAEARF